MNTHLSRRAPDIARNFLGMWNDHRQALDEVPLPYLDHLMNLLLEAEPLTKEQMQTKLADIVPGLPRGTAGRLINLKFGALGYSDLLPTRFN